MKKLFLILLTLGVNAFAGDIREMRIVANGPLYNVTTWGQLDMGTQKDYQVKVGDPVLAKLISLVGDQKGSDNFVRMVIIFNEDGSLCKADVQINSPKDFKQEVKSADQVDAKSTTDIADVKADLSGK